MMDEISKQARIERLNDINYEDALSEGIADPCVPLPSEQKLSRHLKWPQSKWPQSTFRILWKSIYGDGSWDVNPYVWVIEFKRVM
jgi:hypothetical protein